MGISSLSLAGSRVELPLVRIPAIRLQANFDDLDISHGLHPAWVEAEIKQADFTDLSFVNGLVPDGTDLKVLSGKGRLGGRIAWGLHTGLAQADAELTSEDIHARFGKTDLQGSFTLRAKLADLSMPGGTSKALPGSQFEPHATGLKINSGTTQLSTSAHLLGTLEMDSSGKHGHVAVNLGTAVIRSNRSTSSRDVSCFPKAAARLLSCDLANSSACPGDAAAVPQRRKERDRREYNAPPQARGGVDD